MTKGAAVVAAMAGAAVACGPREPAPLRVRNAVVAEPLSPEVTAAYFRIENPRPNPDTLLTVESPIAATAGVHTADSESGMGHMHPTGPLAVPAWSAMQLKPGGNHLMLEGLRAKPTVGDSVEVILHFARAGAVHVWARVVPYADLAERAGGQGDRR